MIFGFTGVPRFLQEEMADPGAVANEHSLEDGPEVFVVKLAQAGHNSGVKDHELRALGCLSNEDIT